uniref:Uncharacterized protein n=1 Tax=Knipowitschia caucasica TaxID=637954 RepID=A0AAV2JHT6_KNICA
MSGVLKVSHNHRGDICPAEVQAAESTAENGNWKGHHGIGTSKRGSAERGGVWEGQRECMWRRVEVSQFRAVGEQSGRVLDRVRWSKYYVSRFQGNRGLKQ